MAAMPRLDTTSCRVGLATGGTGLARGQHRELESTAGELARAQRLPRRPACAAPDTHLHLGAVGAGGGAEAHDTELAPLLLHALYCLHNLRVACGAGTKVGM